MTDNNVGAPQSDPSNAGFRVRVAYDAAMNTNYNPTVSFTPDVASTLTYDPAWSWWVSSTIFQAGFDVADANVPVTDVGVNASGAKDIDGNPQDAYSGTNNFSIDTASPPPVLPQVLDARPTVTNVTTLNLGANNFALYITYSQQMYAGTAPAVALTPDVTSGPDATLAYDAAWSGWNGDTTCFRAAYDVLDSGASVSGVSVTITGARDPNGDVQAPKTIEDAFSIDMGPVPPTATVQQVATSVLLVTDDVVTDESLDAPLFTVWVTYDQTMEVSSVPLLTFDSGFPGDVSSTLTYNAGKSWWVSYTKFMARYDVADADVVVPDVGIDVSLAYDRATERPQQGYSGTANFSIDTLDPPPPAANATAVPGDGANPPAPLYTVTAANVTSPPSDTFSLSVSYDQAMNPATAPTITLTNEDPNGAGITSTLQYDAANSLWLDNQHFQARYTVIDNGIYIPHVDVGIAGAVDAAGNLQNPATLADLFSINTAAAPITVTSVQPQAYVNGAWTAATQELTDANIGTDTFRLNVYYSAASVMNTPTITYSPDVSTALTLDPNWSFWISSTEYRATYSVSAADVAGNPLQIKIEGARDTTATHYDQAFYVATAPFTIDTTNPPPQNLTANAASQTEIDLTWTDTSPNATGYVVQYSSRRRRLDIP